MAQVEALLGAGDADVAEAPFLFELVGIAEAAHVREHAVFQADEEHDRVLEALGRVQRHQRDGALRPGSVLVDVGDERDRLEERLHAREALRRRRSRRSPCPTPPIATRPVQLALVDLVVEVARRADELLQVLEAALRLDRALRFELGEVAALGQHRFERAPDTVGRGHLDFAHELEQVLAARRAPCR